MEIVEAVQVVRVASPLTCGAKRRTFRKPFLLMAAVGVDGGGVDRRVPNSS